MHTTSRSRVISVLLAAVVLIGGANLAAYAANGKPLLLGKKNVATKTTTVQAKGPGPALKLKAKAGQPPLAVNRTTKVNKLNADLVDGADAADLESLVHVYVLPHTGSAPGHEISFPGLPPGLYLMNYTVIADGSEVVCFTTNRTQGLAYSVGGAGGFRSSNGSAVLDTTDEADRLACNALEGSASIYSSFGGLSEVTFTRLDALTSGTPTLETPGVRSSRGGPAGR